MPDPSVMDSNIATQLDAVRELVQRAAASAGDDRTRAGMLNAIDLMLHQPVRAAHLLEQRRSASA